MSSCLLYPLPSVTIRQRLGSICGNFLIIENHGNLKAPLLGNSGCTFGMLQGCVSLDPSKFSKSGLWGLQLDT